MAQAVEKRSYSRISGETSDDSVTATSGRRARDRRADPALVLRIGEAVQKPDRHGLDLLRGERIDRARDAVVVERHQHGALRIDALAHRQAQPRAAPAAAAGRY